MERKILGTTIDLAPARRDLVLAGGFSSLVSFAATQDPFFLVFGVFSGMLLGAVLHILPPEPHLDDDRTGRIAVRGATGAVCGMLLAPGINWLASGAAYQAAAAPSLGEMLVSAALGFVAGLAWYIGWGYWETREGAPRHVSQAG